MLPFSTYHHRYSAWIAFFLLLINEGTNAVNGLFFFNWLCKSPVPQKGNYKVSTVNYNLPNVLDVSNTEAYIVYPSVILEAQNTIKFPLLIFAHGYKAGDRKTSAYYSELVEGVASFGFIVIAPRSCNEGCPPNYRLEMIKLLDWVAPSILGDVPAEDDLGILRFVNHNAGYGLFGHSMGGRATARNLHFVNTTQYNIRAGVALHPAPSETPETLTTVIPFALYTGTKDSCCGESVTKTLYNDAIGPKAYANMIGARHSEPTNTLLGRNDWTAYVAAWFQIYLFDSSANIDTTAYSYNLIYGTDSDSLCGGSIDMRDDCEAISALP
jgi:dienelactone hydrolase